MKEDWLEKSYREFYESCEFKPFTKTKHKCITCRECGVGQYNWCLLNSIEGKEEK